MKQYTKYTTSASLTYTPQEKKMMNHAVAQYIPAKTGKTAITANVCSRRRIGIKHGAHLICEQACPKLARKPRIIHVDNRNVVVMGTAVLFENTMFTNSLAAVSWLVLLCSSIEENDVSSYVQRATEVCPGRHQTGLEGNRGRCRILLVDVPP